MIEPALTPEEWARQDFGDVPVMLWIKEQGERHALAALCLREQSFGFTWLDVDHLRAIGELAAFTRIPTLAGEIADRIEALLPPRAS